MEPQLGARWTRLSHHGATSIFHSVGGIVVTTSSSIPNCPNLILEKVAKPSQTVFRV